MRNENNVDVYMGWAKDILCAYISNPNNKVDLDDVGNMMTKVFYSLSTIKIDGVFVRTGNVNPAVSIDDSIHPDYIVCLEDGRKMKMLKRHLKTAYGMTPEQYRAKWGLSPDYPMVAPNYSTKRSSLAKSSGLGTASTRGRRVKLNVA